MPVLVTGGDVAYGFVEAEAGAELKFGAGGALASEPEPLDEPDGGALLLLFVVILFQTDDMLVVEQPTSPTVIETMAAQAASETRIHGSL